MKKIILFLSGIFVLFLLFSCPSEIVKKTYWEGKIKGDFNLDMSFKDSHNLEIYIRNENSCRINVEFDVEDYGKSDQGFEGNYTLDNGNYAFEAKVKSSNLGDEYKLEFEGILNTTTGEGSGKVKFTKLDDYDLDEMGAKKANWEVKKVY